MTTVKKKKSPYDPVWVSERDGISLEDAIAKVNKMKADKVTSLKGFISRWGEEEGRRKYEKFRKTSDSKSLQSLQKHNPENWEELWAKRRESCKRCVEYYTSRGYSEEDAIKAVSEFQKQTAGVHREYWISKGYSLEEVDSIIKKIDSNKGNGNSYEYLESKGFSNDEIYVIFRVSKSGIDRNTSNVEFPNHLIEGYNSSDSKLEFLIKNFESLKSYVSELEKEDRLFDEFCKEVNRFTNTSIREYNSLIPDMDKLLDETISEKYVIDHNYSKRRAFLDGVPPEVCGSVVNLQCITHSENSSKRSDCWITKEELFSKYEKFNNEINKH